MQHQLACFLQTDGFWYSVALVLDSRGPTWFRASGPEVQHSRSTDHEAEEHDLSLVQQGRA
jgi:hypothetical protein